MALLEGTSGVNGILTPQSSLPIAQALPPDAKIAVRNFAPEGTTRNTLTSLSVNTVQPVSGQLNDNNSPQEFQNTDFSFIDGYRKGSGNGSDSLEDSNDDLTYPFVLQPNGNDDELAYMALQIQPSATQDNSDQQNLPQTALSADKRSIISNYSRFFLQGVVEAEQEKYQVVETFTSYYAFFYGKRPPIYRYTGTVINDSLYRWNNDLKFIYENFFRGTKAAEYNAEVVISYDGRVVIGFPLGLTMQQEAVNDKGIPFAMDVLVISHTPTSLSDDVNVLLDQAAAQRTALKQQAELAQALSQQAGPSVQISDLSTNGILPPASILPVNVSPTSLGGVSQLAVS